MEAARTSEMLVNFYQTTRCYNPEDSNLHKKACLSLDFCVETVYFKTTSKKKRVFDVILHNPHLVETLI
jgi:hypothetical protein